MPPFWRRSISSLNIGAYATYILDHYPNKGAIESYSISSRIDSEVVRIARLMKTL